MSRLDDNIRAAKEMGLSYGYYKALTYDPSATMVPPQNKKKHHRSKNYTDAQLFKLWQDRHTDEQIGQTIGVSRQYIQRWRDQLELPSTSKTRVDTKKYRLTTLRDGTPIVVRDDDN